MMTAVLSRRPSARFGWAISIPMLAAAPGCSDSVAPVESRIITVQFPTVVVPGTTADMRLQVAGDLYLPPANLSPFRAVVVLPTSAGIQLYREPWYALLLRDAGWAVLIVDSFGARGIASAVEDQGAITSYQLEADAFGALAFLRGRSDILPASVAIMGGSKGGTAALNSAFLIREQWRGTTARFAAHVAISPDCSVQHRSVGATGAPVLMVLGENDDYTDPAACLSYAERISEAPAADIALHQVPGADHGWERLGPVVWLPTAENLSRCSGVMEDSGRISVEGAAIVDCGL